MEAGEWVLLPEAAKLYSIPISTLQKLVRDGKVRGVRAGVRKLWVLAGDVSDAANLLQHGKVPHLTFRKPELRNLTGEFPGSAMDGCTIYALQRASKSLAGVRCPAPPAVQQTRSRKSGAERIEYLEIEVVRLQRAVSTILQMLQNDTRGWTEQEAVKFLQCMQTHFTLDGMTAIDVSECVQKVLALTRERYDMLLKATTEVQQTLEVCQHSTLGKALYTWAENLRFFYTEIDAPATDPQRRAADSMLTHVGLLLVAVEQIV